MVTAGKPEDESEYEVYSDGERKLYVPKNVPRREELRVDMRGLWMAKEPEVEGISLF